MMKIKLLMAIAVLLLAAGCVGAPLQSISGAPLTRIASLEEPDLFAAHRDGRKIAFVDDGLILLDHESGQREVLSKESPNALKWDPAGTRLAAAFPGDGDETRLVQYSSKGQILAEHLLPVSLCSLNWSARGDLLAAGYALRVYSFGGNLQQLLYRIEGEEVAAIVLADTTLKPGTVKALKPILADLLAVVFSPYGDELVFVRLHDPPEFAPSLSLLYRNWQSDHFRKLTELPLQIVTMVWKDADGPVEAVTEKGVYNLNLWPESESGEKKVPGYRFVAGRLYNGEELVVDWGKGAHLQLLDDHYLLGIEKSLYLGDGLNVERSEEDSDRKWTLRRWRFERLITFAEYQTLLRKAQQ